MILSAIPIYTSSNGDTWRLLRDANTAGYTVRHDANEASGGKVTYEDVKDFLAHAGSGPEYSALRELLKQLEDAQPPHTAEVIFPSCNL
jgi:hypothetical protein